MRVHALDTTRKDEGDRDVHLLGCGKVGLEQRQQRVLSAGGQERLSRSRFLCEKRHTVSRCSLQVIAHSWDHMTDPPSWVGNIAVPTRDHMQVKVRHGLASSRAEVHADIEPVRADGVRRPRRRLDQSIRSGRLALPRNRAPGRRMAVGDDEAVPGGDSIRIPDGEGQGRPSENAIFERRAEWAGSLVESHVESRTSWMASVPCSPASTQSRQRQWGMRRRLTRMKEQTRQR